MTTKFIGKFTFENNTLNLDYKRLDKLPSRQEWNNYSIWEFNGKQYHPASTPALKNLADVEASVRAAGYSKATKPAKRKPTSIKYAICTFGIEDFKFIP